MQIRKTQESKKILLSKLFPKEHPAAVASGEADFELAMGLFGKNCVALAMVQLEEATRKGYPMAKFMLAVIYINEQEPRNNLLRACQLLEETADSLIANAKYMQALLIVRAKKLNYCATGAPVIQPSHSLEEKIAMNKLPDKQAMLNMMKKKYEDPKANFKTTFEEKNTVNKMLISQQVLDHLKAKYSGPEAIVYAKKLLGECRAQYQPAIDLMAEINAAYPESVQLAVPLPVPMKKKKKKKKKSVAPVGSSVDIPIGPADAIVGNHLIDILKTLYRAAYEEESVLEKTIADTLKKRIAELEDFPRDDAFWTLLQDGFTQGCGAEFFNILLEYGLYTLLFPPDNIFEQSANDTWLTQRLTLIDTSYKKGERSYKNKAAALLVVKELPPIWNSEDLHKIHAKYQIPFPCDAEFKRHVHYLKAKKEEFLYYIGDDPLDIVKTLYRIVYDEKAAPEEMIAATLEERVAELIDMPRSSEFWTLIRKGFTQGCGELFFTKLQEYGAYSILFPSHKTREQRYANDAWLREQLAFIDTRHAEGGVFAYASMAAVLLVVKELPNGWKDLDLEKIHKAYQIPFPCNKEFKGHVEYVMGRKKKFLQSQREVAIEDPHPRPFSQLR